MKQIIAAISRVNKTKRDYKKSLTSFTDGWDIDPTPGPALPSDPKRAKAKRRVSLAVGNPDYPPLLLGEGGSNSTSTWRAGFWSLSRMSYRYFEVPPSQKQSVVLFRRAPLPQVIEIPLDAMATDLSDAASQGKLRPTGAISDPIPNSTIQIFHGDCMELRVCNLSLRDFVRLGAKSKEKNWFHEKILRDFATQRIQAMELS